MKNQISVEYLGTFGWIMLVVMVTILALAQFGILDLSSEFPEECYLGEQIDCKKQYLDENGNLVLTLESNYNKEIEITDLDIEGYEVNISECSSLVLPADEEVNIICKVLNFDGSPQLFVEKRQQFDLDIEILPEGSSETYIIEGSIISEIIDQNISSSFSCSDATGGVGQACEYDWQCLGEGNLVSEDEYLGNDFCCRVACVENPCGNPPSGSPGVCCTTSTCDNIIDGREGECSLDGDKVCCESCHQSSSGHGDIIIRVI